MKSQDSNTIAILAKQANLGTARQPEVARALQAMHHRIIELEQSMEKASEALMQETAWPSRVAGRLVGASGGFIAHLPTVVDEKPERPTHNSNLSLDTITNRVGDLICELEFIVAAIDSDGYSDADEAIDELELQAGTVQGIIDSHRK